MGDVARGDWGDLPFPHPLREPVVHPTDCSIARSVRRVDGGVRSGALEDELADVVLLCDFLNLHERGRVVCHDEAAVLTLDRSQSLQEQRAHDSTTVSQAIA